MEEGALPVCRLSAVAQADSTGRRGISPVEGVVEDAVAQQMRLELGVGYAVAATSP
jgi:hypothetical protein